MVEPLSDNEKEEMKALQDERKATEGHITDSQRARLSELQNRVTEAKQELKDAKAEAKEEKAAASSQQSTLGGSKK